MGRGLLFLFTLVKAVTVLLFDLIRWRIAAASPPEVLAAKLLVTTKQLALYHERGIRPRHANPGTKLSLIVFSRFFDWRELLVIVKPQTFIRWHRQGFKLFWRWKCRRSGRPSVPGELREIIQRMAEENPCWGEERIAAELSLKLGLRVSPRTVRKYWPKRLDPHRRHGRGDQRWSTFVRNHAEAIVACDFCTVVTATFRVLYVFVVMELGSRKILHCNVTANPTAEWTARQLREAVPCGHPYRFLIHDRDSIFSKGLDQTVKRMGLRVLKSPVRAPKANAFCERLIGTIRRECLDWLIPLSENHLRRVLARWVRHYNEARPHSSLGPGIPDPPPSLPLPLQAHRHRLPEGARVVATPILGGLHHEYRLNRAA